MPAKVEGKDPAMQVQPAGNPPDLRPPPVQREPVRHYKADGAIPRQVDCLDRDRILGYQRLGLRHELGHAPIVRDGFTRMITRPSPARPSCGKLVDRWTVLPTVFDRP